MQRVSAIGLLLIFLAAQLGVTIGTHYCQGEAVHTQMLFGASEVPDCGMMKADGNCERTDGKPAFQKHCCEDEKNTFRNERDQIPSHSLRIETPVSEANAETAFTATERKASFASFLKKQELTPPLGNDAHSPSRYGTYRYQVFRL